MLDLFQKRPRLPDRAEMVVIGAGLSGISLLHWLRRRDVDVVVLERGGLAAGATSRNAGFIVQGVGHYAQAIARHGRDAARDIWAFTAESHALLRAALPEPSRVRYLQRGSLAVAGSEDEAAVLEESATQLRAEGFEASWLPSLEGPLALYAGGLVMPYDAEVDSAAAVHALADAGARERVFENIIVEGLEPSSSEVAVHTTLGVVRGQAAVLATNAYTRELLTDVPITPARGQMLATEPLSDVVVPRPTRSHWGSRFWRQLSDGRVIVGGYRDEAVEAEQTLDDSPTDEIQRHLDRHLREVLGITATVTHRWAGTMGFTPDGLPLVGEWAGSPHCYVCAGYSGRGLSFAFKCAETLVNLLLDGTQPPAWLAAGRTFAPASERA